MAELHIIGQIISVKNFTQPRLSCKWNIYAGTSWKILNGVPEGQTQECCDSHSNAPVWDHPLDLHYSTNSLQGAPKILLQIFYRDHYNRILFLAYGLSAIPLQPGSHKIRCHTWKPMGDWNDKLKEKFLGTTVQLKSPNVLVNSDDRFELTTQSSSCYNSTNSGWLLQPNLIYDEMKNVSANYDEYSDFDTTMPEPMYIVSSNRSLENRYSGIRKIKADVCQCDLMVASCDINCCCDKDCNEFHLSVFLHCKRNEMKIYHNRYCYKQNSIVSNYTPNIYKKIVAYLFCIVRENFPSTHNPRDHLEYDLKLLKKNIKSNDNAASEWFWNRRNIKPTIDVKNLYQNGDLVWTIQGGLLKPLEFTQPGFTSQCTFKKSITYLDNWKESCYQINLSNENKKLFVQNFIDFSVLSTPLFSNSAWRLFINQTCPGTVCVPLKKYYCADSWDHCTTRESRGGFCSDKICENIVKEVKYLFHHNGTEGIKKLTTFFKLANISSPFFQLVEVEFEWIEFDNQVSVKRSGNPGYITGTPIIIGTFESTALEMSKSKSVTVYTLNRYLTLAYATKTGDCDISSRYNIAFGENAKTSCSVVIKTTNFSTSSCQQLQNKTFQILLQDLAFNSTDKKRRTFVLKHGHIFDTGISNWVQVLTDAEPVNSAEASVSQEVIQCNKMITSLKVHILHSSSSKYEGTNNHLILGSWVEFSNETTLTWPRCLTDHCVDVIQVTVNNFVTFHDASKPSRYHFAIGPYLDLSLPNDFFYPFVNNFSKPQSSTILIIFICFIIHVIP